jgi:hypothetical protein
VPVGRVPVVDVEVVDVAVFLVAGLLPVVEEPGLFIFFAS